MPDLVTCKFDKDPIKNERASVETIRILHGCEVQLENSVPRVTIWHHEAVPSRGSLFGITKLCRVMQNSDLEGRNFLSARNTHVLHTFRFRMFYCKSSIHYHTK